MSSHARPAGAAGDALIAVMGEAHGLDVSPYADAFLASSLEKRRKATSHRTDAAYLAHLPEDRAEAEILFGTLRIAFSEFFRDPLAVALLERTILPALAKARARSGRGEIRVWSAGCATGQEAWSVAILLDDLATTLGRPVPHRIFATDRSTAELETAERATYSTEALANVRLRQLGSAFSRRGDAYTILPQLRERVDFSLYDLLDPGTSCPPASIYGDFDLILCCNVLLYYRSEAQRLVLDKARRSLAPGGYLITGETEQQIVERAGGFRAVAPATAVFRHSYQGR